MGRQHVYLNLQLLAGQPLPPNTRPHLSSIHQFRIRSRPQALRSRGGFRPPSLRVDQVRDLGAGDADHTADQEVRTSTSTPLSQRSSNDLGLDSPPPVPPLLSPPPDVMPNAGAFVALQTPAEGIYGYFYRVTNVMIRRLLELTGAIDPPQTLSLHGANSLVHVLWTVFGDDWTTFMRIPRSQSEMDGWFDRRWPQMEDHVLRRFVANQADPLNESYISRAQRPVAMPDGLRIVRQGLVTTTPTPVAPLRQHEAVQPHEYRDLIRIASSHNCRLDGCRRQEDGTMAHSTFLADRTSGATPEQALHYDWSSGRHPVLDTPETPEETYTLSQIPYRGHRAEESSRSGSRMTTRSQSSSAGRSTGQANAGGARPLSPNPLNSSTMGSDRTGSWSYHSARTQIAGQSTPEPRPPPPFTPNSAASDSAVPPPSPTSAPRSSRISSRLRHIVSQTSSSSEQPLQSSNRTPASGTAATSSHLSTRSVGGSPTSPALSSRAGHGQGNGHPPAAIGAAAAPQAPAVDHIHWLMANSSALATLMDQIATRSPVAVNRILAEAGPHLVALIQAEDNEINGIEQDNDANAQLEEEMEALFQDRQHASDQDQEPPTE